MTTPVLPPLGSVAASSVTACRRAVRSQTVDLSSVASLLNEADLTSLRAALTQLLALRHHAESRIDFGTLASSPRR